MILESLLSPDFGFAAYVLVRVVGDTGKLPAVMMPVAMPVVRLIALPMSAAMSWPLSPV